MKLDGITCIKNIDFDIPNRTLTVYHNGQTDTIEQSIIALNLRGKKRIVKIADYFQITLAVIGFIEVLRRFFGIEKMPDFSTMIIVFILALITNGTCLHLLQKVKRPTCKPV